MIGFDGFSSSAVATARECREVTASRHPQRTEHAAGHRPASHRQLLQQYGKGRHSHSLAHQDLNRARVGFCGVATRFVGDESAVELVVLADIHLLAVGRVERQIDLTITARESLR